MPVRTSPEVQMVETEGESVLLHMGSGQFFGLDEVGSRVWHMLGSGSTVNEIIDSLAGQYGADREQVGHDVAQFLRTMRAERLIIE